MKKTLLLASTLLFAACAGDSPIVGAWTLDAAASAAASEAAAQDEAAKAALAKFKERVQKARIEIDVTAGGTFTMHKDQPDGDHTHVNGRWTLQGDTVTLTGKEEGKDQEETHTGKLASDELRMDATEAGQKMTMVFRRKR